MVRGPAFCDQPATDAEPQNRGALETAMNAVLATKATEHWVEVLEAVGVPCGPVYNYAEMFDDPQVRHRGLVQYASDPELGEVPHIRTPVKIGGACGCGPSPRSSASTTSRSSAGSASARRNEDLRAKRVL
jgi:crotonobetainyl-CoA:carnitine CoA-transferase CaiB-like acyl-CoA transferase